MLPPFIIEQIRRREERERARPQPQLEVPRERTEPSKPGKPAPAEESQRGVVVIDLMGGD